MWSDSNWCQWNPSVYIRIYTYVCIHIYIYTRCPREAYDAGGAESNGEIYVYGWWIYDRCKYERGSPSRAPSSAGSLFAIRRTSLSRQTGLKGFFIARDSTWITLSILSSLILALYLPRPSIIKLSRNSRGDRPRRFVANEISKEIFFLCLEKKKGKKIHG